jgi:RNA polymerase sigma factor (sigma-70 family)
VSAIPARAIDMAADEDRAQHGLGQLLLAERRRLIQSVRRKIAGVGLMEAEDIVSDVFYQVLRRGDFVAQVENLTAYLYRALANRITDYGRARRRERTADLPPGDTGDRIEKALEPVSHDLTPEEALRRKELRLQIRSALEQLNANERAVWIATEIEGRTFQELSSEWQVPLGTLLSRKSRAGNKLRLLLQRMES